MSVEEENARLKAELAEAEASMASMTEKVKYKLAMQISERRRLNERAEELAEENASLQERVAAARAARDDEEDDGGGVSSGSGSASTGAGASASGRPPAKPSKPPAKPQTQPQVQRSPEEETEAQMLIEHIRQAEHEAQQVQKKVRIKLQHLVIEKHALNIRLQELETSENSVQVMQEMRTQLAQLLDDKTTLMQQWTELKATMENAQLWQTQNAQLARQIQLVEGQRNDAQAKLDSVVASLSEADESRAKLRSRKKKLGAKIEKRKGVLETQRASQQNAAQWKAQNEFLRVQLDKIRKANVVLVAKVEDAQSVSLSAENSHEGAALTEQAASNAAVMQTMAVSIQEMESDKIACDAEAASLTSDVEALVAEVTGLKMKIQTLTREATKSSSTNSEYRRSLLNVLEEKGTLSLRVNELLSKLKLLEEWEEENDELYFGMQELLDENARLEQRMSQLRAAAAGLDDASASDAPEAMDISLNAATREILAADTSTSMEGEDDETADRFAEMRKAFGMSVNGSGDGAGSGDGEGRASMAAKSRQSLRRIKGRSYSQAKLSELQSLLQDSGDASDVTARIQKDAAEAAESGGTEYASIGPAVSLSLSLEDDSPEAYFADKPDIKYIHPGDPGYSSSSSGPGSSYPAVKCGTLYRLVERLTFEKYPDMEYVQAFMLTYRSFTNPIALMEQMIARYCITAPSHMDESQQAEFKKRKLIPIRLRVYNVLRGWVDKYFRDFEENEELLNMLRDFASNIMTATGMKRPAASLLQLLERKMKAAQEEKANQLSFESLPPPPKSQIITNPLSINIKDLARNMCLLEMQLYQSIPVTECLNNRWAGANKAKSAPGIFRSIASFNKTTMWVTTEVVKNTKLKPKARAKIISFYIKLAVELKSLNNLNGVMEIIAGLSNSSVKRLKKAWARVDSKLINEFDSLKNLTSNHKSYAMLRNHIHVCKPPCIPYLGVSLTDLTFIEDGNADEIYNMINFVKRRMAASVIREIVQYQADSYDFTVSLPIANYLMNLQCKDDDECYDLSLLAEPRT